MALDPYYFIEYIKTNKPYIVEKYRDGDRLHTIFEYNGMLLELVCSDGNCMHVYDVTDRYSVADLSTYADIIMDDAFKPYFT